MTDAADRAKTNLFVRGIPAAIDNSAFLQIFSSIGPVQSAFTLEPKSTFTKFPISRLAGSQFKCGFVHFALADDALKAVEEIPKKKFHGKSLSVELAKHRHRSKDQNDENGDMKPIEPETPRIDVQKIKDAKNYSRTVVVSGVGHVEKKQLFKKLKKLGNVAQLDFPAHVTTVKDSFYEEKGIAHVRFSNTIESQKAVKMLHNHVFKGETIMACIHPHPMEAKRTSRVIIRNLKFNCKTNIVASVMMKYGPFIELSMPMREDNVEHNRGFCFVTFASKEFAEKAMSEVNGKIIPEFGRMVVLDLVTAKKDYEFAKPVIGAATDIASSTSQSDENDSETDRLSEKWASDAEEEGEDQDQDEEDIHVEVDGETIAGKESDLEDDDEEKRDINMNDAEDGRTLFVRNLSFETTDEDLNEKFSEYGTVVYARIVMDRQTGLPKGTGFVRFKTNEEADAVIEKQSVLNDMEVSANLLPESTSLITLSGRPLFVMRAITKNSIDTSSSNSSKTTIKSQCDRDKRNVYLLKEMLITPSDPVYSKVGQTFLDGINEMHKSRVKKLQKQMYMAVSRTRLSLRHLGKTIDSKELKKIAKEAVYLFKKNFKEEGLKNKSPKQREEFEAWRREGLFEKIDVCQSKVVADKVTGKSMGFGFVEFPNHAQALACLRYLKNNQEDTKGRRWAVEFAVENTIILKKRIQRRQAEVEAAEKEEEKKKSERVEKRARKDHKETAKGRPKNEQPEKKDQFRGKRNRDHQPQIKRGFKKTKIQ